MRLTPLFEEARKEKLLNHETIDRQQKLLNHLKKRYLGLKDDNIIILDMFFEDDELTFEYIVRRHNKSTITLRQVYQELEDDYNLNIRSRIAGKDKLLIHLKEKYVGLGSDFEIVDLRYDDDDDGHITIYWRGEMVRPPLFPENPEKPEVFNIMQEIEAIYSITAWSNYLGT
jgi:hypothetical protein